MNSNFTGRVLAIVLAAFLLSSPSVAQTNAESTVSQQEASGFAQTSEAQRAQSIRKLLAIKESLEDKRERVRNLLEQLAVADEAEKAKIMEQVSALRETIDALTTSFENIAASGVNLRSLAATEDQELDWRNELIQFARPILNSLKAATEKPRRIEELRRSIRQYEQQLEVTRKATESVVLFDQHEMPPEVAAGLDEVTAAWRERSRDIENSLEISRDELRSLEVEEIEVLETIGNVLHEFLLGRGLTLLLALLTGIAVWFVMRGLRRLVEVWRGPVRNTDHAARIRLLLYAYHLVTIVLVALAVLTVFYVRGDLLLLSLTIIALVMLALGAWRFLPGYILEARLLLNVGAAREGERVIYNGLPFRIASLNLYSELRNPELEGSIRLPLSALARLISRPRADEVWFPCSTGDYLLLPDGSFAQVLQQTVETVRLSVVGSTLQYRSADFLQLDVRNLSRQGFGVVQVFGIDYQHQEISLDQVPERFRSGLNAAFESAGLGDDLKDLLVDFKEAGTDSLNYLIYASMHGRCAGSYFKIIRLIQQTCVDVCNQEGWGIPFTQVTIHQADPVSPG